ncbi:MAG: helix-turn-helix domain-containing protein [Alphaproteobacteria bacterium]|nr:helix-turn-helix domain-containing protein [Alphaproteobacteria bacterium]
MGQQVIVKNEVEAKLLTVKEFCKYMGVGETTARQMLSAPNCPYRIRIGGRLMANKTVLDKWIESRTGK